MKRKRYTEEPIIGILTAHEAGAKVGDLVRPPRFLRAEFVPLEVEARWDGSIGSEADSQAGGGECPAEEVTADFKTSHMLNKPKGKG